jgi:hypothetical protein
LGLVPKESPYRIEAQNIKVMVEISVHFYPNRTLLKTLLLPG